MTHEVKATVSKEIFANGGEMGALMRTLDFTFSYSPTLNEIGGVFTAASKTTERVLGERRLRTLRELAAKTRQSQPCLGGTDE